MKYINDLKKILEIITADERRKLMFLFVLMIIGMIFETFGIAIVVPLLEMFGNPDQNTVAMMALLVLVGVYILKNLFLMMLVWKQSLFSTKTMANLSSRLFDLYLHQPYTSHLQNNSVQLIRNITGEVSALGGFGQAEIVRYLDVSAALISYVFRSSSANEKSAPTGVSYGY